MTDLVLYEVDERVGIVTMNRPDKLNALNLELKEQLGAAFKKADADPATRVVILRAAGRAFCVGYDIGGGSGSKSRNPIEWHDHLIESLKLEMMPWTMKKPVIAEVRGYAVGGGCELAAMCDLTIAGKSARFGEPEVRFSNLGPAMVLPWLVGLKRGRELLYFGDQIDADEALRIGLVNKVVPDEELSAATLKYAKRLSMISSEALYAGKVAINRGAELGFTEAMNSGVDVLSNLYATETQEGKQFKDITKEKGLKAALDWRGAHFKQ